jgi:hypothetical protein
MADTDVKCSTESGATESETRRGGPPSRSPSTVALGTAGGLPTRIRHLQPQPVTSRVYHAIAEVIGSFETLTHHLQDLQQFNFFPADNLTAWLNIVLNLQADANSHLLECLHHREMNNAGFYDRLCMQWERQLRDPDDCLIEAEHRKQELAEEQKRSQQEPEPANT